MMKEKRNEDHLLWYKDAIIYELHIKAFCDSNGDGIGDFGGLLQKLDYLQDLGVTTIWLLPFYPSPLKDDGYDIADYYTINPSYGTLDQFRQLLDEAHRRNLKVITELVINHTSDQHPWFQRARQAAKGSPERDFYVWTDDPSTYKDVRIIFQDFEASNWTWDPVANQYYWHRFFHHQPDLNFDNPLVQQEVMNVLDYWCSMGVDGFRLDAVPYLYEREGTNGENLPETHAFLKKLRAHIDEKFPGTVFLAEANMWPEDAASYFGEGDECHMNYHFPVMPRMFMALHREDRYPITDIFDQTPDIPFNCQWAMFLRNHDELTLEMVTDEERDYMYRVYAKDPKARINLGIRHRLAPLMDNNRRKIELMNSLLFSMPGTPVIYYGDEIGMGDNFYLGDRNGVRTPMQWSPDRNAGFSSANPHSLYLPVIMDPEYNYEAVNVELQRNNTSSLFWYMKRMITVRKQYQAFGRGSMDFIAVDNPKVLAFTRQYEDEVLLIVVNLSKYAQAAEISLPEWTGHTPVDLFSRNPFPVIRENVPYFFTLGAHSFQWFELQPAKPHQQNEASTPHWEGARVEDLLEGSSRQRMEQEWLPTYLPQTHWFLGSEKNVQAMHIRRAESILAGDEQILLMAIEVQYETDLPEGYVLPLGFAPAEKQQLVTDYPEAILATAVLHGVNGWLLDANYLPSWQRWLIMHCVQGGPVNIGQSRLQFNCTAAMQGIAWQDLSPRIHTGPQINTSITYNNQYFLKLYRKIDTDIHPDVELSAFLTGHGFTATPAYLGSIIWEGQRRQVTLGLLQVMVENHGDGKGFMRERVRNFIERIMARNRTSLPFHLPGAIVEPVPYESLDHEEQAFLGGSAAEFCLLLGKRVAHMHRILSEEKDLPDFKPEPFSLHYQRSLFAGMQSVVREAFQLLDKIAVPGAYETLQTWARSMKADILLSLKRIYDHKLEALKTRIHGNLHLQQVLLTGKDIAIHDFGGNPFRNYSNRRLRRSPLRDVAAMIRSIFYVAYKTFLESPHIPPGERENILPLAGYWAHYMSGFFLQSYLEENSDNPVFPSNEDRKMMLEVFLLEGAIQDLSFELKHRQEQVIVPLQLIYSIMHKKIPLARQEG